MPSVPSQDRTYQALCFVLVPSIVVFVAKQPQPSDSSSWLQELLSELLEESRPRPGSCGVKTDADS